MVIHREYRIGYGKPPNKNKYYFNELEIGQEKTIIGTYRLVLVAARSYSNKNNVKIIAINNKKNILIKRIK